MGNHYDSTGQKIDLVSRTKAVHLYRAFPRKHTPRPHTFLTAPVASTTGSILPQVLFHGRHIR